MKVLVAAASRHGSTAEIAAAIATAINGTGHQALVVEAEAVASLAGYDAAVIGSAVYAGSWLPAAEALVDRHLETLRAMPVWTFSSGPLGDPPKPLTDSSDAIAIAEQLHAREHRTFAGELDRDQLGRGERLVVAVVRAPAGDYRPWNEILAWGRSIGEALTAEAPSRRVPLEAAPITG